MGANYMHEKLSHVVPFTFLEHISRCEVLTASRLLLLRDISAVKILKFLDC